MMPPHSGFFIETPRLLIRSFTEDDAEAMFKVFGDPETMRFFSIWLAKSVDNARGFIRWVTGMERDFGYSFWAVVEKQTGEVIGDCGLAPLEGEGPEVELGCDLRRDHWNMGYATEAGAACLEYGFSVLKLDHIIAVTHPDNIGARHVLEKLGMKLEGRGQHYGAESLVFNLHKPDEVTLRGGSQ
jgi:[ribosomal protein S5]-alanine N-acetyltransferase